MSYVRKKNIKGKEYLYEQRSDRVGGKVKTTHVKYIGKEGVVPNKNENYDAIDKKELGKTFGYTEDINEAGYIMTDGKLIDFSGKRQASGYKDGKPLPGKPDYLKGGHNLDHREINKVIRTEKLTKKEKDLLKESQSYYMNIFGERTGAIRFFKTKNSINVEFFKKPTSTQLSIIRQSFREGDIIFADFTYKKKSGNRDGYDSYYKFIQDI